MYSMSCRKSMQIWIKAYSMDLLSCISRKRNKYVKIFFYKEDILTFLIAFY